LRGGTRCQAPGQPSKSTKDSSPKAQRAALKKLGLGHSVISPLKSANYSIKSKIRELFGRFFVQFWGFAQEGPLPGNFTQFRSLSLCLCTFYSIWLHEKLLKEGDGRLEHFCWNMHDHVMNCKGLEAAGIAWKWQWNIN